MDLQFQEITAEKLGEMMPYYSMRHNKTCDSVFLESFIWKEFYHVQYAIWEGKAVVWLMENDGEYFSAMPLCREEDLPRAFDAIERYFNETLGRPLVIHLADEYAVQHLNLPEERYLVEEQPDAKDYLYEGNALRNLPGKKLHKKKNRVNAFKKAYEGRYEYRRLCCSDSFDVWQFLDKWRQQKGEDVEEHLDYEVRGIHDILKNCSDLYVRMGGVYIDEKLEAFTIGSYNPVEDMAVIHIEKANPEVNGLYQYINQQFLLEEFPEVAWVNREDDLGLEGLRKAKMSYMPADFARKYLVKQRTDRICFLEGEEKKATVPLWKTCFTEDSDGFVEYYYREKTKENRILVKQKLEAVKRADDEGQNSVDVDPASADGKVLSMVHLNPYQLRMQEQEWTLDYLVAVATDPAERRKGHVRELFEKLLHQEASEGKPVTYLVPANPELAEMYGGMGFAFIGNLPQYELKAGAEFNGTNGLCRRECRDVSEDCETAAAYMEQWLSARYEMYTRRDAAYVSRLLKELASEGGHMDFLYASGRLVGLQAVWGLEKQEQRLLYAEDAYTVKTGEKPWNMARLTDLPALLSVFDLKTGGSGMDEMEEDGWYLLLEVEDPILEENNGCFLWGMGEAAEEAEALEEEAAGAVAEEDTMEEDTVEEAEGGEDSGTEVPRLKVRPAELLSFLFGYRAPEEIWPGLPEEVKALLEQVDVVNGVLLDEIV